MTQRRAAALTLAASVAAVGVAVGAEHAVREGPTTIEELTFRVDADARDRFVEIDGEIWTAYLAKQPGFLGKEVWLPKRKATDRKALVKLVVRWRSQADWDAVPRAGLEETERRFAEAMADIGAYKLTKVTAYQSGQQTATKRGSDQPVLDVVQLASDPEWRQKTVEIRVAKTPDFGPNKRYRAIRFRDALESAFGLDGQETEGATLVFRCVDGYEPTMPLAVALKHDGWLAYADLDLPEGQPWEVKQAGGKRVSAAPCYLVWTDATPGATLPWPYALAEVRLLRENPLRKVAFPHDAPEHVAGYEAFVANCSKCHRLYGVGGDMGPELASPRGVTTYWRPEALAEFIRAPGSFRAGARMPAMRHLSSAMVDSIIDYLEHLAGSP